jgi:hypothetical protein
MKNMRGIELRPEPTRREVVAERARAALEKLPGTYLRIAQRRTPLRDALSDTTDVLIEGFPRSGNSFLVSWVGRANPDLEIASHMHSVAHISAALRCEVPVVVVIRSPEAALASLAVFNPQVALDTQIERYRRFHEGVADLASEVIISPFPATTATPHAVVSALERRLGRPLVQEPPGGEDEVLAEVDRRTGVFGRGHDERRVGRPTESRRTANEQAREWLRGHRADELARLQALHDDLAVAPTAVTRPAD